MTKGPKLIVGGSASSGTSLLVLILDRHSHIYCGPETNIFTKADLLLDWEKNKSKILRGAASKWYSSSWHIHNGVQMSHLIEKKKLSLTVNDNIDFSSFVDDLVRPVLISNNKTIFVEKTPSNSAHFELISSAFPNTQLALMVRHPYDAIGSMVQRGWSVFYATGLYLYNVSLGMSRVEERFIIKYEDLVASPSSVLTKILEFIGLSFEENILISDQIEPKQLETGLDSWNNDPNGPISQNTDTFDKMESKQQRMIKSCVNALLFKKNFEFCGLMPYFRGIPQLMNLLGYELDDDKHFPKVDQIHLQAQMNYQKVSRTLNGYPYGFLNFPFELNWSN